MAIVDNKGPSTRIELTIVEDYVFAAMKQASFEQLEGGTVGGWVPGFGGVLAFGSDVHECAIDLFRLLEGWVETSLASHFELPVVAGIDLNAEADRLWSTYNPEPAPPPTQGEFYANEDELEAAFQRHSRKPT